MTRYGDLTRHVHENLGKGQRTRAQIFSCGSHHNAEDRQSSFLSLLRPRVQVEMIFLLDLKKKVHWLSKVEPISQNLPPRLNSTEKMMLVTLHDSQSLSRENLEDLGPKHPYTGQTGVGGKVSLAFGWITNTPTLQTIQNPHLHTNLKRVSGFGGKVYPAFG